jgi:hypothetical protein
VADLYAWASVTSLPGAAGAEAQTA